ncbi:CLEC12A isoform 8 [Pongo abelii]|uniref:CLEC12A isoform 8 n=1 Tax=Pongo abelii TaxID=9601 RepID=A0A2J8RGT5_PONAB|nr:CLEC12A isoform 8 [Pongo abelii]
MRWKKSKKLANLGKKVSSISLSCMASSSLVSDSSVPSDAHWIGSLGKHVSHNFEDRNEKNEQTTKHQ